jgi:hypothetical protein
MELQQSYRWDDIRGTGVGARKRLEQKGFCRRCQAAGATAHRRISEGEDVN